VIELTQTNLEPGNCWQYAWASVLEVDPAVMPDQVAIEAADGLYSNALQAYLRVHHESAFVSIHAPATRAVRAPLAFHIMIGPTVRTEPVKRIDHCVVAEAGEFAWDPHPSRAGLIAVTSWELLMPFPEEWREGVEKRNPCVCPACTEALS